MICLSTTYFNSAILFRVDADIEIHVTFELLESLIESKLMHNIVKSMILSKNASFDVVCKRFGTYSLD